MKTECWAHGKSKEAADPKAFGAASVASQRKVFYFRSGAVGTPQRDRGQVARSRPVFVSGTQGQRPPFCREMRKKAPSARICPDLLGFARITWESFLREGAGESSKPTKHQAPRARIALYRLIPRYTAFCTGGFAEESKGRGHKAKVGKKARRGSASNYTRGRLCSPKSLENGRKSRLDGDWRGKVAYARC